MDMSLNLDPKRYPAGVASNGAGPSGFLATVRSYPLLEAPEEYVLAKSWCERRERDAAHQLITSHLRLVVKLAGQYRGYGLAVSELVSEGSVGLMHAVERFDPERGCRFATYATWWIRAAIQEYVLRSWSLVKIGTTANQKKLFFGLRRAKGRIAAYESGDLRTDQAASIALQLGVSAQEVVDMNRRLGGDVSLNAPIGDDADLGEWQDRLVDERPGPESQLVESEDRHNRRRALGDALAVLNARERRIFERRHLAEPAAKLDELASEFGITRERIRQIEVRAFEKVQKAVKERLAAIERA